MAAVIIEGRVLSVTERSGKRDDNTPWSITTARVLVADRDVTEVTFDPQRDGVIEKDDHVAVLADAGVYRGGPSFRALEVRILADPAAA